MEAVSVVKALNPSLTVQVLPEMYQAPDNMTAQVDSLWSSAIEDNSQLFDGKLLCLKSLKANCIICQLVPYRFIWAQVQLPELRQQLELFAVAVSGLTHTSQAVLFGRRHANVTQYPGYLELAPSGGIDAGHLLENGQADYKKQLLDELTEETGITAASLLSIQPVALVYDPRGVTYDICCRLQVLDNAFDDLGLVGRQAEYEELVPVRMAELSSFIAANSKQIMPASLALLENQQSVWLS